MAMHPGVCLEITTREYKYTAAALEADVVIERKRSNFSTTTS